MLAAYVLPAEVVGSAISAITVAVVYGLIQVSRVRERVAKLEEWIRQEERKNGARK